VDKIHNAFLVAGRSIGPTSLLEFLNADTQDSTNYNETELPRRKSLREQQGTIIFGDDQSWERIGSNPFTPVSNSAGKLFMSVFKTQKMIWRNVAGLPARHALLIPFTRVTTFCFQLRVHRGQGEDLLKPVLAPSKVTNSRASVERSSATNAIGSNIRSSSAEKNPSFPVHIASTEPSRREHSNPIWPYAIQTNSPTSNKDFSVLNVIYFNKHGFISPLLFSATRVFQLRSMQYEAYLLATTQ